MEDKKVLINEEDLESVVGGLFEWAPRYNKMKYTRENGSVSVYKVINYDKAYSMSCSLHGQNVPEDEILSRLISAGYIEG